MDLSLVVDVDLCREATEVENAACRNDQTTSYLPLSEYQAWQYHAQPQPIKCGNATAAPAEKYENAVLAYLERASTRLVSIGSLSGSSWPCFRLHWSNRALMCTAFFGICSFCIQALRGPESIPMT